MGGPERPTLNPEQLRQQQEARDQRIESIQDKTTADTRDILLRFGRRKAFAGVGDLTVGGQSSLANSGLLGGRLDLLRSLGNG